MLLFFHCLDWKGRAKAKQMQTWKRRLAKMQKNANLDTAASQNARLAMEAGQNAKKMQAAKPRPAKMQKQMYNISKHMQKHANMQIIRQTGTFPDCLAFREAQQPLSEIVFGILACLGFQACFFFAFWLAAVSRFAFDLHLAGSRPPQPKKTQKKCNTRDGSKHNTKRKQHATKLQH